MILFFNSNTATRGGAVRIYSANASVIGSSFVENKAAIRGSGIYTNSKLNIVNPGEVRDNKAGFNISDIASTVVDGNAHITGKVSIGDNYENYIYSTVNQGLNPSDLSKTTFDLDLNKTVGGKSV